MSRFAKHINQGITKKLDEEETVTLIAAGSSVIAKPYFNLMKAFKNMKPGDEKDPGAAMDMFNNFTDSTVESITTLILETLKASYPEEPEEVLDKMTMKHMMTLMPVVMELYAPVATDTESKKKIAMLNKLKAKPKPDNGLPEQD